MTIDLRWLSILLPFVTPFGVAGTMLGLFSMTGLEMDDEGREIVVFMSFLFGTVGGMVSTIAIFGSEPVYRKLW